MILVTFRSGSELRLGVKTTQGIIDVAAASEALGADSAGLMSIEQVIDGGQQAMTALKEFIDRANEAAQADWILAEDQVSWGPCLSQPGKIICVGLNYKSHAEESQMALPTSPILFSKFNNSLAACGDEVPLPSNAVQYDYEAELVAVIGKQARDVSEADALDYVFGYCNGNDVSARELQFRSTQWLLGKSLDKFMPIGPYLVTADEIRDPQNLGIRCKLNGEMRQDSNTQHMIFSVAYLISYVSQYMTLEPGDLISTGTPEGVIFGMKEPVWLKPGDHVVVEIDHLGQLENSMVA